MLIRTPQGHDHQEDDVASLIMMNYEVDLSQELQKPIGLKLTVNQGLVARINREMVMQENRTEQGQVNRLGRGKKRVDNKSQQRLNAVSFPARWLKIGSWQKMAKNEGELTVKCYPRRKRMAWEVLNGNLKQKIEFNLTDVAAIKAGGAISYDQNHGVLQVLLKNPPSFFQEVNPVPRKHTNWQLCSDFTHAQSSMLRLHTLIINPEVLDKNYKKLLSIDNYLTNISKQPFPTTSSNLYFPQLLSFQHATIIPSSNTSSMVTDIMTVQCSDNNVNYTNHHDPHHGHPTVDQSGKQQYSLFIEHPSPQMNHLDLMDNEVQSQAPHHLAVASSSLQVQPPPISSTLLVDRNQVYYKGKLKMHSLDLPVWRPIYINNTSGMESTATSYHYEAASGLDFNCEDSYYYHIGSDDNNLDMMTNQQDQQLPLEHQQYFPHHKYCSSDDNMVRSNYHPQDDVNMIPDDEWLSKLMDDVGPLQLWDWDNVIVKDPKLR